MSTATAEQTKTQVLETKKTDLFKIDPRNIIVQEGFNGRKNFDTDDDEELYASVKENGVRVPLLVKKKHGEEKYFLVNGERRLRAAMRLVNEGVEIRVPATMFTGNDTDAVIDMLITNDNVPLTPIEEAEVLSRLEKMGLSQTEISRKTGRTQAHISQLKKLHDNAPQKVKNLISQGLVSSHLVMQILRDFKDNIEEGFKHLEDAVSSSNGKKVTAKTVAKRSGKVNSYGELKKLFVVKKKGEQEERKVKRGSEKLYEFAKRLVNNEIKPKELNEILFEN